MSIGSNEQFISLQEATALCPYSQEYLSLRARQGKLRAVKIKRNWFTKNDWVYEYIVKSEEYKKEIKQKQSIDIVENKKAEAVAPVVATRWVDPPLNLPIEEEKILPTPFSEVSLTSPIRNFQEILKLASYFVAVVVLLGFVSVAHKDALKEVSFAVYPIVQNTANAVIVSVQQVTVSTDRVVILGASVGDIGSGYISWFSRNISGLSKKVIHDAHTAYQTSVDFVRSFGEQLGSRFVRTENSVVQNDPEVLQNVILPENPKKGMVVVPSTGNNAQIKAQVQQSFSDEVQVTPQDDESGIITPVFRDAKGDDYFYILVPLQSP